MVDNKFENPLFPWERGQFTCDTGEFPYSFFSNDDEKMPVDPFDFTEPSANGADEQINEAGVSSDVGSFSESHLSSGSPSESTEVVSPQHSVGDWTKTSEGGDNETWYTSLSFTIHTRKMHYPTNQVPDRIYSSLVYELVIAPPHGEKDGRPCDARDQLQSANLNLIDSANGHTVNVSPSAFVSGRPTTLPFNLSGDGTRFKFQINPKAPMTFHKTRKKFSLRVIFESTEGLLAQFDSAPFKVYAKLHKKKQTQKQRTSPCRVRKRRRLNEEKVHEEQKHDEATQEPTIRMEKIDGFKQELEILIHTCDDMTKEERQRCLRLLLSHLTVFSEGVGEE